MRLVSVLLLSAIVVAIASTAQSVPRSQAPAASTSAEGPMGPAIGNTLVVSYPAAGNVEIKFWLAADGTFTMETADGQFLPGEWSAAEGRFCTTLMGGDRRCEQIVERPLVVGQSFTMVDSEGQEAVVTVRRGR